MSGKEREDELANLRDKLASLRTMQFWACFGMGFGLGVLSAMLFTILEAG